MSVKIHQQYRATEGTKVYVVDPDKLRQKVVLENFQFGKTKKTVESLNSAVCTNASKNYYERKPRKRRLESEDTYEDEDDLFYAKIISKETTTRAGRVTKSNQTGAGLKLASKSTEQPAKGKKREPASIFRCSTCQKVYIGYAKLKLHFRKFPDHYSYSKDNIFPDLNIQQKKASPDFAHVETQTDLKPTTSVEVQVQTTESKDQAARSKSDASASISDITDNNSERAFNFCPLTLPKLQSSFPLLNDLHSNLCAQATSSTRGISNFGAYRNNGIDSSIKIHPPVSNDDQVNSAVGSAFSGISNHGSSTSPISSGSHFQVPLGHHHQQQMSSKQHPLTPVSPTMIKNNVNSTNHVSNFNDNNHSVGYSVQKLIWDVIEDKMIQHGINEALAELSDVADKLAKIARDKIIPIREEEEEQLRANNTAPIVQVDTPFLSHLLDLPFGTYMFKEDAGIRRLPHPPAAADLSLNSLTGGVEVDIDKFLPEIDLNNLPHLSNIDFSSICNDS